MTENNGMVVMHCIHGYIVGLSTVGK